MTPRFTLSLAVLGLAATAAAQNNISNSAPPPPGADWPVRYGVGSSYSGSSCTDCTIIDFEGLGDQNQIGTISGQPSVTFGPSWFSLVDADVGGSGNIANEPSPDTVAYFTLAGEPIDFSSPVFFVEVAYVASASSVPVTMKAWDGPGGTGNVVATATGTTVGNSGDGAPCSGDPGGSFCLWDYMSLTSTSNNILSITLEGAVANQFGFDDMTFCRKVDAGTNYCGPAIANSTGNPGVIIALGSDVVGDNCLILAVTDLPSDEFCYFLNSPMQGFVQPPGSVGNLCLSGNIGRHTAQAGNVGTDGTYTIQVDLNALPRPFGGDHIVMAGETWNFTNWYRDGGTSNFTDAVSIIFQ